MKTQHTSGRNTINAEISVFNARKVDNIAPVAGVKNPLFSSLRLIDFCAKSVRCREHWRVRVPPGHRRTHLPQFEVRLEETFLHVDLF